MKLFSSKLKSSADFYAQIALMLGIVIAALIIFAYLPIRWDISEARVYSLSQVTRDALKDLDDTITIKGYFTKDVPGYLVTVRGQVQDMLKQYRAYGKGNVRIAFVNPNESPEKEREAASFGIPLLRFDVLRKDKLEVAQGYMGVAVIYGDKREVIPVVQDIATFEFDLTAAIKKVLSGKKITIGIAEFPDRVSKKEDLRILRETIGAHYAVEFVDLETGKLVPEYITTLVIPGARGEWSKRQLYVLDQFAMSGRGILFFVDGVTVDEALHTAPNASSIFDILRSYGVTVNKDLIYDPVYQARASFSSGGFLSFTTAYGFWVQVPPDFLNKDNALVNKLESVMLPWVSSLSLKEGDGVEILVKTSDKSRIVAEPFDLSPQAEPSVGGSGGYPVAVSISAPLSSHFSEPESPGTNEPAFIKNTSEARVMVVADGDMITDGFMNQFRSDEVFIQNLVDGLSLDPALATIRSKSVTERPIKQIDDTTRRLVKYGNIVGVPFLVVMFALLWFAWRRKSYQIEEI